MIPFSPPRIDQKIIDEVTDALKSGWITTGPKTKAFEKKITEYCGNKSTLCVSSATAGLELILRWFGVKVGDEVIIPVYTYCATANVVVHCGAKPVMVDINPHDFNISVENIKKAISSKTKVIMPVDIGGWPADYDEINALVNSPVIKELFKAESKNQEKLNRILVLSDAAHSLGASYKGKKTGSLCDITVFSFHAVKNLTTAEGGAIALNLNEPFNNQELYNELNIRSLHGQSKDALAKTKIGNWRYDVIDAGYKANMPDITAAIGLVEIERYENDTMVKRKEIFAQYKKAFSNFPYTIAPPEEDSFKSGSRHLFQLRVNGATEEQRDKIIDKIFKKEVSVNVHFQPLPLFSFYKSQGYKMEDYPVAFKAYSEEISLPIYYNLSKDDVDLVIKAVKESIEEVMTGL